MKLTDRTIEVRHGGYYYYSRTEEELQYSIDCRVPLAAFDALKKSGPVPDAALRGAEEVILDRNKLAEGKAFCKALGTTVSLNGKVMAYRVDTQGDENYCLQFVSLESGEPPARPAVGPSRARSLLTQWTDRQATTCPTSCGTSRATASTSLPTRRRRARHPSASFTPCATGTSAQQRSSTTGSETRPKGAKTLLQTTVCCSSRRMRCSVCRSAQPPTRSSSRCGTAARRRMRCLRSTWPTASCGWSAVLPSAARGVDASLHALVVNRSTCFRWRTTSSTLSPRAGRTGSCAQRRAASGTTFGWSGASGRTAGGARCGGHPTSPRRGSMPSKAWARPRTGCASAASFGKGSASSQRSSCEQDLLLLSYLDVATGAPLPVEAAKESSHKVLTLLLLVGRRPVPRRAARGPSGGRPRPGGGDCPRLPEIARDCPRLPEMARGDPRWPEVARGGTRWHEMARDGTRLPISTRWRGALEGGGLAREGLQGRVCEGGEVRLPAVRPATLPHLRAGAAPASRALQAGPLPRHRRPRGAPRTPRDESANHTMHPLAPSPFAAPRRSRTRPPSRARQTTRPTRSLSCSTRLRCRRPGTTGTGRRGASPRATRRGHVQDTSTSCPVRRVARACCPSESRRRRRNQPRLQPRLAEISRDGPRWAEVGRDYSRDYGRDCPRLSTASRRRCWSTTVSGASPSPPLSLAPPSLLAKSSLRLHVT